MHHPLRRPRHLLLITLLLGTASPGTAQVRAGTLNGAPEAFTLEVLEEGRPRQLHLRRHSLRAPGATLRVYGADGVLREYAPPAPTTYRGVLAEEPGSVVLASLVEGRLEAQVFGADGEEWELEPSAQESNASWRLVPRDHGTHAAFAAATPCGFEAQGLRSSPVPSGLEERIAGQPQPAGRCLSLAEIAFDADYEYYQSKGSSVPNVVAAIDAILNQVEHFYARDVLITYELTSYVVRTAPFYAPVDGGDLLNLFRTEWNTNQAAVPRDIAHLMTAKPGSLIEFGGLAWVGVVCTNSGYGWSMDGANIVGHEVGHNWGAGHCHDPSPCNNMCGACFNVGPETKRIIEAHRDSRGCLEEAPHYPTQLRPYAHPEGIVLSKADFDTLGETRFDVLRNDHDGNCEDLILERFDARSAQGGRVRRSFQTGPRLRDELIYTPPARIFVGPDTFEYVVRDPRGGGDVGTVTVDVRPLALQAYWDFDESAGQVAADATPNGFDATAQQPAQWVAGRFGNALDFDGVSQLLSSSGTSFDPPWTVSAWFRRLPGSAPSAALIEGPDGSLRTEQFPNLQKVGLTKYGVKDYRYNFILSQGVWTHLTFVGTRSDTTLYVDGQLSGTRPVTIDAPNLPASRASDPLSGELDELRVYRYAMDAGQVGDLFLRGGPAVTPRPADGGRIADPEGALSWRAGLLADSHDVYFGTSYAAVRDATPASPSFVGNQLSTSFVPGGLQEDVTYFWRVDEHVGTDLLPGGVWQFRTMDYHHWPLDETSGTTAFDAQGAKDGTYVGGVLLNQPAAGPSLGSAVRFDGANDRVHLPPLELHSNRVTISAWVRRNGPQSSFAGLVFSRDGNSTAGLNFGSGNELRYHWNGDGSTWGWNSGLSVPNDTWVFTALVVEPGRATIYLGDAGVLSSAVNTVAHSPEEFDGRTDLGRDPTGGRFFDGWMDDVRIHRGALGASEVDALYRAGL